MDQGCDYYFAIDSLTMLDSKDALKDLMQIKRYFNYYSLAKCISPVLSIFRNVIAPMILRPTKLFSNFWGDIASNGFYARSHDYQFIAENTRRLGVSNLSGLMLTYYFCALYFRGVWNVPYVTSAVLMLGVWLKGLGNDLPSYHSEDLDPDMAFPQWMRNNVILL